MPGSNGLSGIWREIRKNRLYIRENAILDVVNAAFTTPEFYWRIF